MGRKRRRVGVCQSFLLCIHKLMEKQQLIYRNVQQIMTAVEATDQRRKVRVNVAMVICLDAAVKSKLRK